MTPKVLILRPLEGASQTEGRAKQMGLPTVVDPLFQVESIAWSGPAAGNFDALLVTSANAIRFGGPELAAYQPLPVLAVGEKTAAEAAEAGFRIAKTGDAGAFELLHGLDDGLYRNILWLAGEQHKDLSLEDRYLEIVPVYRSKAIPVGEEARACLVNETVILLHSARAAKHLVSELNRLQLPKDKHHVLAFSANVAEAAGQGWKSLQTAAQPNDDALLFLASALCRSR